MRYQKGFTLVELSVVLLIIGLLAGGILLGQQLMRTSELKTITADKDKFIAAVNTFVDKFHGLPGDLINATDIWRAAHATPATCKTTIGTASRTCNGDGNGQIGDGKITVSPWGNPVGSNEYFRFWQQLSNAGLIAGKFTGVRAGSGSNDRAAQADVNAPPSKVSGGVWFAEWLGNFTAGDATSFATDYGHVLLLGRPVSDDSPYDPLLTPKEVWSIDTKMDDGVPGRGRLIVKHRTPCTNAASAADLDTTYNLTNTDVACSLYFTHVF